MEAQVQEVAEEVARAGQVQEAARVAQVVEVAAHRATQVEKAEMVRKVARARSLQMAGMAVRVRGAAEEGVRSMFLCWGV